MDIVLCNSSILKQNNGVLLIIAYLNIKSCDRLQENKLIFIIKGISII